jgi:hypothetical protein
MMTRPVDIDELTLSELREIVSARATLEDLDAPRAPELPVVVEDPETAAACERRQMTSDRGAGNREKWLNQNEPEDRAGGRQADRRHVLSARRGGCRRAGRQSVPGGQRLMTCRTAGCQRLASGQVL